MYRYENNAFRVLGITPSASMKDIMQRVNEIKVKESLGMQATYDYDFAWMGPVDRSAQGAISALQRLENPISRLKEEMCWFWFYTEKDKQAIEYLVAGNRQSAHEIWKEVASYGGDGDHSISALFNQFVLAHSSVIGKEIILRYGDITGRVVEKAKCPKCNVKFEEGYSFCVKCGFKLTKEKETVQEKKKSVDLTEDHWKNWRFVLARFLALYSSDIFWNTIEDKIRQSGDPRLASLKIGDLKENFAKDIVNVNLTFIANALFARDYERAKQHSQLLNGASIPPEILREGLNKTLGSRVELLGRLCNTASQKVSQINEKNTLDDLLNIYESFKKDVEDVVNECNVVDINCMSDYALSRDAIAAVLRNISIKINNSFHTCDKAFAILEEGIAYTASTYLKNSYQKDKEILKSNLDEEKSLQYNEKIGGADLSISKNKVTFGNRTIACDEIVGIRYGIYTHSTNGRVDSRSYKFWLTDNKQTIEIECAKGFMVGAKTIEERFNKVVERLYKMVQIPLAIKMIADFESNKPVKVGGITIDHQGWHKDFSYDPISKGVVSIAAKIFGTEDAEKKEAKKQFLSWNEYQGYNHHQGAVLIIKKNEKGKNELWTSLSLREVWNAVNLSIFLDYLHKDGKLWMIIHKPTT